MQGSPPRARGAPSIALGFLPSARIIPACAWEHRETPNRAVIGGGSSPRARGAQADPARGSGVAWIIPACAGSTDSGSGSKTTSSDHPRVRGEHRDDQFGSYDTYGSSPRARRARRQDEHLGHARGIIPACAGSTPPKVTKGPTEPDHPRVCGEHICGGQVRIAHTGSSPRARGAPGARAASVPSGRIIPACAGSTCDPLCRPGSDEDHCQRNANPDHLTASQSGSPGRLG